MRNKGKRLLRTLVSVLIVGLLVVLPAFAAEGAASLSFSTASGKPGEYVYVTVSLSGYDPASSVDMVISSNLVLDAGGSTWLLSDGSGSIGGNGYGAWSSGADVNINGSVATLAFLLPEPAVGQTNFTYSVSCMLNVKSVEGEQGSASAYGAVQLVHSATDLQLSSGTLELDLVGSQSAQLTATVTPSNSSDLVVWSSSDSAVASVSGGTVTGWRPGTAVITAAAGAYFRNCTVTVTCSHDLTAHEAVAPTCQAEGNNLYYTCNACSLVLDANKAETTVAAQTLSKLPHTGGKASCTEYAICSECSQTYGNLLDHEAGKTYERDDSHHWYVCKHCGAVVQKTAHALNWVTDKEATEDATGLKHQECACGYVTGKNTVIEKLPHVHVGIKEIKAVPATCQKEGKLQYWTCASPKCAGKYYGDAQCQKQLETIVAPVDPANHQGKKQVKEAVEATCGEKGYSGDTYCLGCKKLIEKGEEIPATEDHTPKEVYWWNDDQHWYRCADCDAAVESTKADHTYKWIVDKVPTESAEGKKHQECVDCGHETKLDTMIDRLEHDPKKVEGKAPTCTKEGIKEHFYCVNCRLYFDSENGEPGNQISKAGTVLPSTEHNFDSKWFTDEKSHWRVCDCGELQKKEAHDFVRVGVVDADADHTGYSGDKVCFVCEYLGETGEEVPTTGQEETEKPVGPVKVQNDSSKKGTVMLIWMGILMVAIVVVVLLLRKMNGEEQQNSETEQ